MHHIPCPAKLNTCETLLHMKVLPMLALVLMGTMTGQQEGTARAQSTSSDVAAAQTRIDAESDLVGKAIAAHNSRSSGNTGLLTWSSTTPPT